MLVDVSSANALVILYVKSGLYEIRFKKKKCFANTQSPHQHFKKETDKESDVIN